MECKKIRVIDITYSSSVDGIGFRDVLFVAGCPHHCEGCHNPQTWDFDGGQDMSVYDVYNLLTKSDITDVTFSGGEPFCQPEALFELAKLLKEKNSKDIWIYSGFTFEEIIKDEQKKALLVECDVLVDGKFEIDNKGLNMRFKGSYNQRIIDIKKSLKKNEIVLFN